MPTYEYKCDSCKKTFEEVQKMKDPALTICKLCGSKSIRRLLSFGNGFILNGSGYYSKDSK